MNRRSFFRQLATGCAVLCLIPSISKEAPMKFRVIDQHPLMTFPELYISPETLADIRAWGVNEVDAYTVRSILQGK